MSRKLTAILPADRDWEVWTCQGEKCSLRGTSASATAGSLGGDAAGRAPVLLGLPSRHCRTIALLLPKTERGLLRKMVAAQLEQRGLCRDGSADGSFECHILSDREDGMLVSVDVLPGPLPEDLANGPASFYAAAGRAYLLPEDKAVLVAEQGQSILWVGRDGKLLHGQIVARSLELNAEVAGGLRLALLTLEGSGVSGEIREIELWGEFPPEGLSYLREQLALEVSAAPRPSPIAAGSLPVARHLLAPSALKARRTSSWRLVALLCSLALAGGYLFFIYSKYRGLRELEAKAAILQEATPGDDDASALDQNKAIGERWGALRNVLESKRFPMLHLARISAAIPAGGVVVSSFESRVSEADIGGTARSPRAAYEFFNAIQADEILAVYNWQMPQPGVNDDGRASFAIKGKMK